MDQHQLSLHPREIHLPSFLNTLVEMTHIRARLKGIAFRYQFPEQLPSSLLADDKRLRQGLLNLLSNAVKFTEQGEVNFTLQQLHREQGLVRLRFSVRDRGIGIAKADQHNIFIPFHQLDNPITRTEGSGLGLTISQRIVALMGWELRLRSQPGSGSELWFDLALATQGETLTTLDQPTTPDHGRRFRTPPAEVLAELLSLSGNTISWRYATYCKPWSKRPNSPSLSPKYNPWCATTALSSSAPGWNNCSPPSPSFTTNLSAFCPYSLPQN